MNQALEILGSASDAYVRYVVYSTVCWVAMKGMRWACDDEDRAPEGAAVQFVLDAIKKAQ